MKQFVFLLSVATVFSFRALAQEYYHDGVVQAQISVAETGIGSLGDGDFFGELYYDLFHSKYSGWANYQSKAFMRGVSLLSVHPQVQLSENIDSVLRRRAAKEAVEIADRTSYLDVAWLTEGSRIKDKLRVFKDNIATIRFYGATARDYRYWTVVAGCIEQNLAAVRDGYMPNSERKRQYQRIYDNLSQRNEELLRLVYFWHVSKKDDSSVTVSFSRSSVATIVDDCRRRFLDAAKSVHE